MNPEEDKNDTLEASEKVRAIIPFIGMITDAQTRGVDLFGLGDSAEGEVETEDPNPIQ